MHAGPLGRGSNWTRDELLASSEWTTRLSGSGGFI